MKDIPEQLDGLQLHPGDVVQRDGGPVIVECVGVTTADALPLSGKSGKPVTIPNRAPKHLVIERRGQPGLDKFKAAREPRVRLEPGDTVKGPNTGVECMVISVGPTTATVGTAGGQEGEVPRVVSAAIVTTPEGCDRAAALQAFIAARKSPPPATEQPTTQTPAGEPQEVGSDMSAKTKTARKKKPAEANSKPGRPPATSGRTAFTRSLAGDKSLSVEQIHEKSKAKYPSADLTTTRRIVESARASA